jgi:hypothetical protein
MTRDKEPLTRPIPINATRRKCGRSAGALTP